MLYRLLAFAISAVSHSNLTILRSLLCLQSGRERVGDDELVPVLGEALLVHASQIKLLKIVSAVILHWLKRNDLIDHRAFLALSSLIFAKDLIDVVFLLSSQGCGCLGTAAQDLVKE